MRLPTDALGDFGGGKRQDRQVQCAPNNPPPKLPANVCSSVFGFRKSSKARSRSIVPPSLVIFRWTVWLVASEWISTVATREEIFRFNSRHWRFAENWSRASKRSRLVKSPRLVLPFRWIE